ncbi:unnamed protein product, partial [Bubo scandiacus]
MDAFLKEILKPSEQDTFDHLTRMETPSINTFRSLCREYVLPSANMGLPSHLIQCHHPRPAYTTHTAPVVKMLVEQDERRKAAPNCPAETEPNREPQEAGFEEETQGPERLSGSLGQWSCSSETSRPPCSGCALASSTPLPWEPTTPPGSVHARSAASRRKESVPQPSSVCPGREKRRRPMEKMRLGGVTYWSLFHHPPGD